MTTASYLAERSAEFPGRLGRGRVPSARIPNGSVAAHVLGYVGEVSQHEIDAQKGRADLKMGDIVGKAGAEAQFEKVLRGDRGFELVEVDAKGRPRTGRGHARPHRRPRRRPHDRSGRPEGHRDGARRRHRRGAPAEVPQGERRAPPSSSTCRPARSSRWRARPPTTRPSSSTGSRRREWASLTEHGQRLPAQRPRDHVGVPAGLDVQGGHGAGRPPGRDDTPPTPRSTAPASGSGMGEQWPKWCWDHAGHGHHRLHERRGPVVRHRLLQIGYKFYKQGKDLLQAFARSAGYGDEDGHRPARRAVGPHPGREVEAASTTWTSLRTRTGSPATR